MCQWSVRLNEGNRELEREGERERKREREIYKEREREEKESEGKERGSEIFKNNFVLRLLTDNL